MVLQAQLGQYKGPHPVPGESMTSNIQGSAQREWNLLKLEAAQ